MVNGVRLVFRELRDPCEAMVDIPRMHLHFDVVEDQMSDPEGKYEYTLLKFFLPSNLNTDRNTESAHRPDSTSRSLPLYAKENGHGVHPAAIGK